jgi:tellurite methyltransferase
LTTTVPLQYHYSTTTDSLKKFSYINKGEVDMDLDYWNNYYQNNDLLKKPSSFSEFCLEFIPDGATILELGSGNGRDAIYFAKNGFEVHAVDQSNSACLHTKNWAEANAINNIHFIESDFTENIFTNLPSINVFYSRFTMHSITLEQQNRLLKNVYQKISEGGLFFIEARTLNDPLCGVGTDLNDHQFRTDHYRRFIDSDLFIRYCLNLGFKLRYMIEKDGLSVVNDDNPVLLRVILER